MESAGSNSKRFDVALSFPGEHRSRVEKIAEGLAAKLGKNRVFYDRWNRAELARPNLDSYLSDLYLDQSRLLVFFHCQEYVAKEWCGLEWRVGRELLKQKMDERLMFLRMDPAEVEGLHSIDGYLDIRDLSDEEVADEILNRLARLDAPVKEKPPVPVPPPPSILERILEALRDNWAVAASVAIVVAALTTVAFASLVTVNVAAEPQGTTMRINGVPRQDGQFRMPLRKLTVNLLDEDGQINRTFAISPIAILTGGLQLRAMWRRKFPFTIYCAPGQCTTPSQIQLELQKGEFDPQFEQDLRDLHIDVDTHHTASIRLETVATEVKLLAGDYLIRFIKPCRFEIGQVSVPMTSSYDLQDSCR